MPRDLFSSNSKDDSLVASPESQTPKPEGAEVAAVTGSEGSSREFTIHRDETRESSALQSFGGRVKADEDNNLHPYVQTLSISNLEGCVALENATFPEHERCSREKFIYRLTTCPELCLGLFTTTSTPPSPSTLPTFSAANSPDSATPRRKSVLIAMIIATKTTAPYVTDESMEYPQDYAFSPSSSQETRGHQEHGRTIGIHSLGVLPTYQRRGLAKTIMKSYQQRMEISGIADRIALLAHEHLVGMYEGLGFEDKGRSTVRFGGGGWSNLVYEFSEHGPGMTFGS